MESRHELPDMNFIRREIPIAEVAKELGIRVAGANIAHCWREGHQNGDRTPSMSFKRNRAKCHVCDVDAKSTIDLIMAHQECSLREAVDWICGRWPVPTIAKNTKLARAPRWAASPVGLSTFPLEDFIRSGVWAALDDAARAVLPVLFCFAERGIVSVSYRGLSRYSGLRSSSTVSKAFQQLKQFGILEALPKVAGSSFREPATYRFNLDGDKFQAILVEVHTRLKLESGAERELIAQSRAALPPRALYPGTVSTDSVTRTEVHALKNEACTFSPSDESDLTPQDVSTENKDTCESTRFNSCNTNSDASLNKQFANIPPASDLQGSDIENKLSCESARFEVCSAKAKAPARWQTPTFTLVLSEAELADKVLRSMETARHWNQIVGVS